MIAQHLDDTLAGGYAAQNPVSYTHLHCVSHCTDSHQKIRYSLLEKTRRTAMRNSRARTALTVLMDFNPVSYTHLDVYKRQGVWAVILNFSGAFSI